MKSQAYEQLLLRVAPCHDGNFAQDVPLPRWILVIALWLWMPSSPKKAGGKDRQACWWRVLEMLWTCEHCNQMSFLIAHYSHHIHNAYTYFFTRTHERERDWVSVQYWVNQYAYVLLSILMNVLLSLHLHTGLQNCSNKLQNILFLLPWWISEGRFMIFMLWPCDLNNAASWWFWGDLRDIFVNCNSVSANAVVSLSDNKLFQHVHLQEGNLYDFTTWVTEHPGGQDAITKWTSSGYKLQYPSNHPMDRFETHLSRLQYIGKSGETIRDSAAVLSLHFHV